MRKVLSVVAGVLAAATVLPALAHHSFAAEFDANKPVKLEGTVTKMEDQSPFLDSPRRDDAERRSPALDGRRRRT